VDLRPNINRKKKKTLGLDIGSKAVKTVALQKNNDGYSAVATGVAEIASDDKDVIRHRKNTIKAIRSCFSQMKAQSKLAVCGVSGPEVAVRDFELDLLSPEEMAAAVSLEASQVCPFPADASAIDYQLTSNDGETAKGILVAAMQSLIAEKTQLARDARLKCVLVDVDGLALLNCFRNLNADREEGRANETVAIFNVGNTLTTLAIMGKDGSPFIRDMTYAGDDIVQQIMTESGEQEEAITKKLSGEATVIEQELIESLSKACQQLISDVNETLRYYTAQSNSASIEKLHVCGDFAQAEGFIELLNRQIGAECILWNPFDQMQCSSNRRYVDIFKLKGPALAIAAGLAMRSIESD